jgi:hypothetical protein
MEARVKGFVKYNVPFSFYVWFDHHDLPVWRVKWRKPNA